MAMGGDGWRNAISSHSFVWGYSGYSTLIVVQSPRLLDSEPHLQKSKKKEKIIRSMERLESSKMKGGDERVLI